MGALGFDHRRAFRSDHCWSPADQIGQKRGQSIILALS
jgi:hypothetical protein